MPPTNKTYKYAEIIKVLKKLGFSGPHTGGKHPYMIKDDKTITIPNKHGEIGPAFLKLLLKQWGIAKSTWESV